MRQGTVLFLPALSCSGRTRAEEALEVPSPSGCVLTWRASRTGKGPEA